MHVQCKVSLLYAPVAPPSAMVPQQLDIDNGQTIDIVL